MYTRENSIKKVLLNDATTNKKALVDCEINGWMETHQKKKQSLNGYHHILGNKKHQAIIPPGNQGNNLMGSIDNSKAEREDQAIRQKKSKKILPKLQQQQIQANYLRNNSQIQLKQISFNTIDHCPLKARQRCNSKGYVLKEMRRKIKQQSHLRHFSQNKLTSSHNENIIDMNVQESIDFLQKRYRIISVTSSRTGQRKVHL